MRRIFVFFFLVGLCGFSRIFYRTQIQWVGDVPAEKWPPFRLVAILNHTSLFEFLFAGVVPLKFLWRMAQHATIPIAKVTMDRPIVGMFWRLVCANPVSITRERDDTWGQVLEAVEDPEAKIIILPEGRMKRANGLDKKGRPMSVRSGIADLIHGIPDGKLLLSYSQGLHHIQVPGQMIPKFFKPVRIRFEILDIEPYRATMQQGLDLGNDKQYAIYRRRVIDDMQARVDRYVTSDRGGTDCPDEWS